jgi:hypothetical protein
MSDPAPSHSCQWQLARMLNNLLDQDAPTQTPPAPTTTRGASAAQGHSDNNPAILRAHQNHNRPMVPTFTQRELTKITEAEGTLSFQIVAVIA